jgi:hypothetical protein
MRGRSTRGRRARVFGGYNMDKHSFELSLSLGFASLCVKSYVVGYNSPNQLWVTLYMIPCSIFCLVSYTFSDVLFSTSCIGLFIALTYTKYLVQLGRLTSDEEGMHRWIAMVCKYRQAAVLDPTSTFAATCPSKYVAGGRDSI